MSTNTNNNKSVNASGAVIYWGSADAQREAIKGMLSAAGLSPHYLPSETSTLDAMRAAMTSLYGGQGGYRIEPLKGARKGYGALRMEASYYRDIGSENMLTCELYATRSSETVDVRFYDEKLDEVTERARLFAQIDNERGRVDANKVSDMIGTILAGLSGIRLRDRGGVWWIPAGRIDRLRDIRALLQSAVPGVNIGIMTVQVDDDSVKAAIDSIRSEAVSVTSEVQGILVGSNGVLDSRKLTGMKARLEALTARLGEYEVSLGQALPDITGAVANCQTACLLAGMGKFDSTGFTF